MTLPRKENLIHLGMPWPLVNELEQQVEPIGGSGGNIINTAITTAGAGTLTGAAVAGGVITRSGPIANFNDTTDTAANIIAALTEGGFVGQSWELTIVNTTVWQETLVAGTGVTLSGTTIIAGNAIGRFLATYTGAGAVSLYGLATADRGIDNFAATTDPGVSNDNTQGYGVGSIWINTTGNREWTCVSAATGAAIWSFGGAAYASGGSNPANEVTQFGAGTGLMAEEGNVNRQISSAGVNPGSTGADNVLAVFSLPANSFDGAAGTNRGITITAQGSFGATANTKQVKIIFNPSTAVVGSTVGAGGTTIADSGAVVTNNLGWSLQANVFKYGAANSNTQIGLHQQAQIGNAVANLLKPSLITATENATILIAITGNATTATSDIVFNFLEVNAMN